ncbi:MAG: hypothetical protein ABI867_36700 [Kofleriaceae bacterium]
MTIESALAALDRDDLPATLDAVLDAWRISRDPAVADLVDLVSAPLADPDAILRGIRRYRAAKWRRMERRRDPRDLPALLEALVAYGSYMRLGDWPDDPRLAACLVARAHLLPSDDVPVIVERLRDRRGRAAARARPEPWPRVAAAIERAALVALDPALLAQVREGIERVVRERAARDRITQDRISLALRDLGDLDERAALADWLLERGDPRGELITLLLAPPSRDRTVRANALIATHRDAWLGPLRDAVSQERFVDGFLDSCRVDASRLAGIAGAREWRTVRHVSITVDAGGDGFAAVLPHVPQLYTVWGEPGMPTLNALATGARPELRRLALPREHEREIRSLAAFEALPRLRHVAFDGVTPTSPLVAGSLWRRLEIATILDDEFDLTAWLTMFERPISQRIRTLRLCRRVEGVQCWQFRLTRPATLAIGDNWTLRLLAALRALPARCLDRVVVSTSFIDRKVIARELKRIQR